ncbi:hypothetical protein C8D88_11358 [Lentzea atacamensis]|uniref:Uncharacterized protein n=1 Tax=Lentzea atacamensis TaxID=531938 RepID=A0A316HQS8_9PSEU|nr:hypothetical protein C8D88_11358 [Lentzea atacamensis]
MVTDHRPIGATRRTLGSVHRPRTHIAPASSAPTPHAPASPGWASPPSAPTACAASAAAQTLPQPLTSCAAAAATAPWPSPPPARSGRASSPVGSHWATYCTRIYPKCCLQSPRPRPSARRAGPEAADRAPQRPTRHLGDLDPLGDHLGTLDRLGTSRVDLDVVVHPAMHHSACTAAIPETRSPRASSRPAATAASHRTPTQSTSSPHSAFSHGCRDSIPPRNTSSTMTRAPARTIAATPSIHASSSNRNSAPTVISPAVREPDPLGPELQPWRHHVDQRVDPDRQPGLRQHGLQTPGDPRLAGAGPAVENDHLHARGHGPTVPRPPPPLDPFPPPQPPLPPPTPPSPPPLAVGSHRPLAMGLLTTSSKDPLLSRSSRRSRRLIYRLAPHAGCKDVCGRSQKTRCKEAEEQRTHEPVDSRHISRASRQRRAAPARRSCASSRRYPRKSTSNVCRFDFTYRLRNDSR